MDLTRRDFMLVGTTSLLSIDGGGQFQVNSDPQVGDRRFQGAAHLAGPEDARPDPGSSFFDDKLFYAYFYESTDTGRVDHITQKDSAWTELPTSLKPYQFTSLPTDPPLGQLVFDEDHGTPTWYDDVHGWEWPNFVDAVLTTPQTVANTTTRTNVFSRMINADSLIEGRIYQLDLQGTFSTANTSDTFEVDVNLAGADVAKLQNEPANVTDAPWTLELTFTVRSDGATGKLKADSRATFQEQPRTASHAPLTVDTATATMLDVFIVWSAADPDNSVTLEQAHLKEMA